MKVFSIKKSVTVLLSTVLFSGIGHAQLSTSYTMSLEAANLLSNHVMQSCKTTAKPAAVVVLDQGGNVLVSQRHESVGIHNLIAAERKAFTAYSTKTSSLDFMRNAQENPDAQNLNSLAELLLLGGGVPVLYKNQLIGAVGVAGAGGSVQDHHCAQNGIEKALQQL